MIDKLLGGGSPMDLAGKGMDLLGKGMELMGKMMDAQKNKGGDKEPGKIGEDTHQKEANQITFNNLNENSIKIS